MRSNKQSRFRKGAFVRVPASSICPGAEAWGGKQVENQKQKIAAFRRNFEWIS